MTLDSKIAANLSAALCRQLFSDSAFQAYAILDGASNPVLLDRLYADQPEFACLYRGELAPDIAECAPYLVQLQAETPFTQWLTTYGWGEHWGVFAVADCDFRSLHRHLRTLNMVYEPETHKPLLFRYYDPRVLTVFLPTCDAGQLETFYGPIRGLYAESRNGEHFGHFYRQDRQLVIELI